MKKSDAVAIAGLHQAGIQTGFLSSLGPAFLRQLYTAIFSCPAGFAYVWEQRPGQVAAFIACAQSIGRLYREAVLRRGLLMGVSVLRRAVARPSILRQVVETVRYPSEVAEELPGAEILSIVVSESARRRGVGRALVGTALATFCDRGIGCVKVAVGAGNKAANRFYQHCDFRLAVTRRHHGLPMNIYVVDGFAPHVAQDSR